MALFEKSEFKNERIDNMSERLLFDHYWQHKPGEYTKEHALRVACRVYRVARKNWKKPYMPKISQRGNYG